MREKEMASGLFQSPCVHADTQPKAVRSARTQGRKYMKHAVRRGGKDHYRCVKKTQVPCTRIDSALLPSLLGRFYQHLQETGEENKQLAQSSSAGICVNDGLNPGSTLVTMVQHYFSGLKGS